MGVCSKCIHFRRLKPASQLLAQTVGTTDATISNALIKIQEDENQQKGYEAQTRSKKEITNDEIWDFQPVMSSYCGLQEDEEKFLIAEVKNSGGKCKDFVLGQPEKQSCNTCIYCIQPTGTTKDLEVEKTYAGMSIESTAVGMSTSIPDNLINKHREGVASKKAFEIAAVYASKGILTTEPQYLSYCRKFSNDDDYVIGLWKNSHNTCSAWTQVNETKLPQSVNPTVSTTPTVNHAQDISRPSTTIQKQTRDLSEDILVAGPPQLTVENVKDFCSFLEWILDIQISEHIRDLVKNSMIITWSSNDWKSIQDLESCIAKIHEVRKMDKIASDYWRESYQQTCVSGMRAVKGTDPAVDAVLQLYDAVNAPIASGNPPLTKEMAESAIEIINFQNAIMSGINPLPLQEHMKSRWIQHIVPYYSNFTDVQRKWYVEAPLTWTSIRYNWPKMSAAEKINYRQMVSSNISEADKVAYRQILSQIGAQDVSQFTPVASQPLNSGDPYYDALKKGENTIDSIQSMIDEASKQGNSAEVARLQILLQRNLQQEQARFTMMSNLMKMRHETSMTIIKNMI